MTLGTAFVVYFYTRLLSQPINRITNQIEEFQKAGAGVARIRELWSFSSAILDGWRTDLAAGPLRLELDGVSFGYAADEPVLSQLSFAVEPGLTLGIVGHTGSGKTTIARLIGRLYDPSAGSVRVGGVDVRQLQRETLRSRLSVVTQEGPTRWPPADVIFRDGQETRRHWSPGPPAPNASARAASHAAPPLGRGRGTAGARPARVASRSGSACASACARCTG